MEGVRLLNVWFNVHTWVLGTADQVVENFENGVLPDPGFVHQVTLDIFLPQFDSQHNSQGQQRTRCIVI